MFRWASRRQRTLGKSISPIFQVIAIDRFDNRFIFTRKHIVTSANELRFTRICILVCWNESHTDYTVKLMWCVHGDLKPRPSINLSTLLRKEGASQNSREEPSISYIGRRVDERFHFLLPIFHALLPDNESSDEPMGIQWIVWMSSIWAVEPCHFTTNLCHVQMFTVIFAFGEGKWFRSHESNTFEIIRPNSTRCSRLDSVLIKFVFVSTT